MTNHLNNIRKELRAFAKRSKDFKYTEMSLFMFLMTKMLTFTQQTSLTKDIETKKQEINTSIGDIHQELKKTKAENDKLLKNYNLELIQLMEQGDHVVKSPWSSWQFGANYFYNNWSGTYKGRGDKVEKYPYLGTYTRSNNLFMRTISPNSRNFSRFLERNSAAELDRLSKLGIKDMSHSATSSVRGNFNPSFGLESSVFDQEPVSSLTLLATVKPKQVNKEPVKVTLGTIEGPGDMNFSIEPPSVEPGKPTMKTITFNYNSSNTPTKPGYTGFNMKFEEYNNQGVEVIETSSSPDYVEGSGKTFTSTGNTSGNVSASHTMSYFNNNLTNPSKVTGPSNTFIAPTYKTGSYSGDTRNYVASQNIAVIKSAGTPTGTNGSTQASDSKPFKIYFDVNLDSTVTVDQNLVIDSSGYRIDKNDSLRIKNNNAIDDVTTTDGRSLQENTNGTGVKKAFLTGGSRIGSLNTGNGSIIIKDSKTVNPQKIHIGLAGPLVSGFEIQSRNGSSSTDKRELENHGEISDKVENTSYRGFDGLGGLLVPVKINNAPASLASLKGKLVVPYAVYNSSTQKFEIQIYKDTNDNQKVQIGFPINSEIAAEFERTADEGDIVEEKDVNGNGTGNYHVEITSATGGYTGYKTGLVLTADEVDDGTKGENILTNKGTISFAGHHSIGIQIDADNSPNAIVKVLNAENADITLGGGTSYGIKLSSSVNKNSEIINKGIITLGGDNSAGIAVIDDYSGENDKTTRSDVRAWAGKIKNDNKGKIYVNNTSSIGMYLKLNKSETLNHDNLTNEGFIEVNGLKSTGMRVDKIGTGTEKLEIINKGTIDVKGKNSFGMIALGNSKATTTAVANNTGTINLNQGQTVGMYAETGGEINNSATGNKGILGTDKEAIIGMFIKDANSKGTNAGIINVSGSGVKGVYNSGDFTMTGGSVTVSGANATAFDIRVAGDTTKIQKGTINVTGSSSSNETYNRNNAAVGFYIGDSVNSSKGVEIGDSGTNAPTININKNALLVYNYTTDMTKSINTQSGKLIPKTNTTVNVADGGSVFAFKNIETLNDLKNAINSTVDNKTGKTLNLNLVGNNSSLFTVKNFTASAPSLTNSMKLSDLDSIGGGNVTAMGALGIRVNGGSYKIFTTRGGHLHIDKGTYQLDNNTAYDRVEFVSSSVTVDNGVTINGGNATGRTAIGQRNEIDSNPDHLVVTNNGTINMSNAANGDISATAIAVEMGTALNTATGIIEMTGDKGVAMYGASNSKVENDGNISITTKGAGIIGANKLELNPSNQSINIKNTGTIKAVNSASGSSLEGVIGMYAKNTEVSVANSKIEHSGSNALIDFETNNATKSVGIYAEKSTVTASGDMKLKDKNAGINVVNSRVTVSGGNYRLGNKSIGFILKDFGQSGQDGWFAGTGGTIDLTNGTGSAVYYFDNAKVDTTLSPGLNGYFNDGLAINDSNVTVPATGVSYTYMYAKNTDLKYDKAAPATLTKDKVTFINAIGTIASPKTKVELGSNSSVSMNGNEVIAVYLNNGISAANKGTITLNGNKSVALYGENGGALVNEKDITVNTNGVAFYNKGATTAMNRGANSKITLLGDYGIGMRSDTASGDSLNEGKIESTKLRAIGMSASNGSNSLINRGEINFTGQQSIGLHTDDKGASGHTILNDTGAKIALVDSADPSKANIGIYSEHSKDKAINNGTIEAGHQTVSILSKSGGNVELGGSSTTKVGDNAVAVFSNGGNVDIANGAKISVGNRMGNDKESVAVYYAGSNGTITNSTSNITIGNGSYGFVVKGGLNNTLYSHNPSNGTVDLTTDAVYIYSEDHKGKVHNATNLRSSATGEINYGIYTNGGGTNSGNFDFSAGKGNVGIYSYFKDPNYMNNVNSKGEYIASLNYVPEKFENTGIINVSASDLTNANDQKFGIGMAAGYVRSRTVYNSVTGKSEIKRDVLGYGNIENTGTINVTTPNSIGMYAGGAGSTATNRGNINLSGPELNVGMFLEDGAVGHNYGHITVNSNEGVGIAVLRGAEIVNHPGSTITVNGTDGIGIAVAGGIIRNYGNFGIVKKEENIDGAVIKAPGDGAVAVKRVIANGDKQMGYTNDGKNWNITRNDLISVVIPEGTYDATITLNGVEQTPIEVFSVENRTRTEIPTTSVGIYMDTSGVNVTRPVTNLGMLSNVGIKSVDLIIGTEATNYTTEKYLKLSQEMIAPYNDMILEAQRQGLRKWEIYSGSLTWMATAAQNKNTQLMENVYLVKVPYTVWSGKVGTPKEATDTYNFLDGLEQRYGVEKEEEVRERKLFKKLNSIGNNEHILLVQAFDEMMGHQYGNEQMRINSTGNAIDKEINYLMKDWSNPSKQANKIKVFGMKDEFKTDTAGIIDYTNNAYGIAYVHEDEAIKLGNSKGWYAGIVNNRFKLKDIGKSKEEQNMLKVGIFKKMSPSKDHNGKLTWTIAGEGFVGLNNMERRYLVVDDIFHAKSNFYTYGLGLKNEIGYDIRTSERTSIRPYAALDMEYGRFSGIKEHDGEIRLEVDSNDYYSIKPELGVEFKYKQPIGVRTTFTASLGAAYENELGKVGDADNKARVRYTNADWFNIRGEKDDRKGNGKFDLKLGLENTRFGVTVNAGYDTKGGNVRGGIGFRAIY